MNLGWLIHIICTVRKGIRNYLHEVLFFLKEMKQNKSAKNTANLFLKVFIPYFSDKRLTSPNSLLHHRLPST